MAYFYDPKTREGKQLRESVVTRTFWGDKMLISLVDLEAGATIPAHSHPHEQIGVVIEGEFTLTIGGETKLCRPGDIYVIPGDVEHSVVMGASPARAFEVFSPVREEYEY